MRVTVILERYPQLSETYIPSELRTLWPRHEISIVTIGGADWPSAEYYPYQTVDAQDHRELVEAVKATRPELLHSHYLHMTPIVNLLSKKLRVPFTVRTHSYDVLKRKPEVIRSYSKAINSRRCLGILVFPFNVDTLIQAGMKSDKLHECYPVVDVPRFFDRSPNVPGVLNVGAGLPKKAFREFIEFATRIDNLPIHLYAIGYQVSKLHEFNETCGFPVCILPPVEHSEMPLVYKNNSWLIYTASKERGTVGWPMSIAEAQASGLGVCMVGIRDDVHEYVGEGGFVLDHLSDALDIISEPVPTAIREAGFEQCRRSDINQHIGILEGLWQG